MDSPDRGMDGWKQSILFKSPTLHFNENLKPIPKITGVEKRRSCGIVFIQARCAETLQRGEVGWSVLWGCSLWRLWQRGLLSRVNTSQSLLQGDPSWIQEAIFQALKVSSLANARAYNTPPQSELEEKRPLFLEPTGYPKLDEKCRGHSELISLLLRADLWSTFDFSKQLCSCCVASSVRRATGNALCFSAYTFESADDNLASLPNILKPGPMTNRYVILTLPRRSTPSDITTQTTSICLGRRLRRYFICNTCAALPRWDFTFLCRIKSLGSFENTKQSFHYTSAHIWSHLGLSSSTALAF